MAWVSYASFDFFGLTNGIDVTTHAFPDGHLVKPVWSEAGVPTVLSPPGEIYTNSFSLSASLAPDSGAPSPNQRVEMPVRFLGLIGTMSIRTYLRTVITSPSTGYFLALNGTGSIAVQRIVSGIATNLATGLTWTVPTAPDLALYWAEAVDVPTGVNIRAGYGATVLVDVIDTGASRILTAGRAGITLGRGSTSSGWHPQSLTFSVLAGLTLSDVTQERVAARTSRLRARVARTGDIDISAVEYRVTRVSDASVIADWTACPVVEDDDGEALIATGALPMGLEGNVALEVRSTAEPDMVAPPVAIVVIDIPATRLGINVGYLTAGGGTDLCHDRAHQCTWQISYANASMADLDMDGDWAPRKWPASGNLQFIPRTLLSEAGPFLVTVQPAGFTFNYNPLTYGGTFETVDFAAGLYRWTPGNGTGIPNLVVAGWTASGNPANANKSAWPQDGGSPAKLRISIVPEADPSPPRLWTDAYVSDTRYSKIDRFMTAQRINEAAGYFAFAMMPTLSAVSWSGAAGGIPIDAILRECVRLGRDPWICIHHLTTDADIRALVAYIRARILYWAGVFGVAAPKVYIELSNETWNIGFGQAAWFTAYGSGNGYRGYGKRICELVELGRDEIGDAAWDDSIILVVGYQGSGSFAGALQPILDYAHANGRKVWQECGAYSPAPYATPAGLAAHTALTGEPLLAKIHDLVMADAEARIAAVASARRGATAYFEAKGRFGVRCVAYEGGLHPTFTVSGSPDAYAAVAVGGTVVTKGAANTIDALPGMPTLAQVLLLPATITVSAVTYKLGVDYRVAATGVDWSLGGAEPSPGATYTIDWRYGWPHIRTALNAYARNDARGGVATRALLQSWYDHVGDDFVVFEHAAGFDETAAGIDPAGPHNSYWFGQVARTGEPSARNEAILAFYDEVLAPGGGGGTAVSNRGLSLSLSLSL